MLAVFRNFDLVLKLFILLLNLKLFGVHIVYRLRMYLLLVCYLFLAQAELLFQHLVVLLCSDRFQVFLLKILLALGILRIQLLHLLL